MVWGKKKKKSPNKKLACYESGIPTLYVGTGVLDCLSLEKILVSSLPLSAKLRSIWVVWNRLGCADLSSPIPKTGIGRWLLTSLWFREPFDLQLSPSLIQVFPPPGSFPGLVEKAEDSCSDTCIPATFPLSTKNSHRERFVFSAIKICSQLVIISNGERRRGIMDNFKQWTGQIIYI